MRVGLDLAEDVFCFAHCQQILRLLSLRIHFPWLSIFLYVLPLWSICRVLYFITFRLFSFLKLQEVACFIYPSLSWSSHWSICLVLGAEAWVPFCAFLCPSFVWWRCNSHCQSIRLFDRCRCASLHVFNPVLSSISTVSISSSVSFMKEMSLVTIRIRVVFLIGFFF